MANAPLDENSRQGIICVLNTDPTVIVDVKVNPTTHGILVTSGTGQTDNGNNGGNAQLDDNGRFSWYGLASDGSGRRIIVYCNSSGAILTEAA